VNAPTLIKTLVSRIASLYLGKFWPHLSSKSITMSTEPVAAMAAAPEPVPGAEEKKIEAAEAPMQTLTAPAPAPEVPVKEEKKSEASETQSKTEPAPGGDVQRPVSPPGTPLFKLFAQLPSVIADAQYTEMWGVELTNSFDVPTSIVLEKFLRANTQDVAS